MTLDFLSELLYEASEDEVDTSSKDIKPNNDAQDIKDTDKGNQDDTKDVKVDSETGEEDESADDNTPSDDSSDTGDDLDTDNPTDNSVTPVVEDKDELRKKVNLYKRLEEVLITYQNLKRNFTAIVDSDINKENLYLFNLLREKVIGNIHALKDLMMDEHEYLNKPYKDLLAIYNIYMTDIRAISNTLRIYSSPNKK